MNIFCSNEYYGNEQLDYLLGNTLYFFHSDINHLSVFDMGPPTTISWAILFSLELDDSYAIHMGEMGELLQDICTGDVVQVQNG
jgi:hypothetical protein